ncbi:RNA binding protein [Streptococcus sp. DD13]|nr:RNA binding protein [Streptococcus sp. DD13]
MKGKDADSNLLHSSMRDEGGGRREYSRFIMSLSSKQRAYLSGLAQSMRPIIQIGKQGLNDPIKTSVRQALDARELIKISLLQNTDETVHEVAATLEEEIGAETVRKIGRVIILYKPSSKKENRKLSAKVKLI